MDTIPQSKKHPFKPRKAQILAPVTSKTEITKPKRRNRRRRKKGRKFGKELQNRGDLVYIRKDQKSKECSTAETDKSADVPKADQCKRDYVTEVFVMDTKIKNADHRSIIQKFANKKSKIAQQKNVVGDGKRVHIKPTSENQTSQKKVQNGSDDGTMTHRKNPQNVEAYRDRITKYIIQKDKSRRIESDYIKHHKTITEKIRCKLVDWIVDVSFRFKLLDESLFAGIWIMDRYFSKELDTKKSLLQLIGVTSLMLASKFEEVYPPSLEDYLKVCDGAYSETELLDMEARILSILEFDISVTSSLILFRYFTRSVSISRKSFFFGEYLLHCALMDAKSFKFSQNQLSTGAIFLVNKMFKEGIKWDKELGELTNISESKVKVVAKELYKILKRVSGKDWGAIRRKFSRVEVMEVAKFKVERVSKSNKK